jgi:hypothetical protein
MTVKCIDENGKACSNYKNGACLSWTGPCKTEKEHKFLNEIEKDKQEKIIFINAA